MNILAEFDKKYLNDEIKLIGGIDEAGRGPLCGPVTVAMAIMPLDDMSLIEGVNDSKKLSEKKRFYLYNLIKEKAISYYVCSIDNFKIDEINILNATKLAMNECLNKIAIKPDICLIDAVKINNPVKTLSIIKGDALSYNIAAASILAKVTRDLMMYEYDKLYPLYDFCNNKGYGTSTHIAALKKYGATPIHRKSFISHFIDVDIDVKKEILIK